MTFSIVAYDIKDETWGVAVASKFPAVGAIVPWAQAGAGAIATQSFANVSYGMQGIELLRQGMSAESVLARLISADTGRETRQVGIVDKTGRSVSFTGKECMPWAGGLTGAGYAIQGNILTGPDVVYSMESAFLRTDGDLPTRLYAALMAGDRAGGDKRGRQSAAILIVKAKGGYGGYTDRMLDYRVDDDPDPVVKLGELIYLHRLYFGKSPENERIPLAGAPLFELQKIMARLGYLQTAPSGLYDKATREAFRAFIGNENFEERCEPEAGWIDAPVYDYLLRKFGK
ncbi:MAG: fimbrial assembly protein FimA [Anaerolineae bacterium]|nr:MAG: fimbrial assembly protein FimA [Anaerolineae bacterium]